MLNTEEILVAEQQKATEHLVAALTSGGAMIRGWKEAKMTERELAVTFPGSVGEALGLDIDMVLQQDPFDWAAHS